MYGVLRTPYCATKRPGRPGPAWLELYQASRESRVLEYWIRHSHAMHDSYVVRGCMALIRMCNPCIVAELHHYMHSYEYV